MKLQTALTVAALAAGISLAACSSQPGGTHQEATTTPQAADAYTPTPGTISYLKDASGNKCIALDSNGYCPGDDPPAASAPAPAASAPAPAASTPPPAAPQYTVSQQQAIDAADNYLAMGSGFSRAGLIQQLSSQYGSGFSVSDATFAVDHVTVDWYQQAVLSAQNYMSAEPGWSCSGLVQQLDSQYGGQFTLAQAEHGARSVGLGSC
jgi:Host cell surface-exposed lipoprotein